MSIMPGDNYEGGIHAVDALLKSPCSEWKLLNAGNPAVAERVTSKEHSYAYLSGGITSIPRSGTLKDAGVTSVDAVITVITKSETVSTVWVASKLRGKGYGKALYELAHARARTHLMSSDDLGTMSLAVWLSLYAKHPSILIRLDGIRKVPRSRVKIKNLTIEVEGEEYPLTDSNGPDFKFWWPK